MPHSQLVRVDVSGFVTHKLRASEESNNYSSWKEQVLTLIESNSVTNHIDGSVRIPSKEPRKTPGATDGGKTYDKWATDKVVRDWILDAISEPELRAQAAKHSTAKKVWTYLEKRFDGNENLQQSAPPMDQSLATVNVGNFVTLKLLANRESNNYTSWKVQMLSLMESHNLTGFIDGSIRIPSKRPTETTDNNKWTTDKVVRGWILGAISEPELLVQAGKHSTARKVWSDLEKRFGNKAQQSAPPMDQSLATVNVGNFVTLKLLANRESNNYTSWKVQMLNLMESHNLMGFFDGNIRIPSKRPIETTDDNKWRTDKVVRGWILGAISEPELMVKVAEHSTAKKVWLDLEKKFNDKAQQSTPPTYLSLATVNVDNFVTVKLLGNTEYNNYSTWKVQVLSLIKSHHLMGYIDGRIQIPLRTPTENKDVAEDGAKKSEKAYNRWRTDKVVRGWILGAISEPRLLEKVANQPTASKVWLDLETKFGNQRGHVPGRATSAKSQNIQEDLFKLKVPLIQAALDGNWDEAKRLLDSDTDLNTAMTWVFDGKTVSILEVAVGTGKAIPFVHELLQRIPKDTYIPIQNHTGATALHTAAAVGNKEAAELLVNREPVLCYISNKWGNFPIHSAAQYKKRNTLEYLISVTRDNLDPNNFPNPYASTSGLRLLISVIDAEFYDIAIFLVKEYSYLAGERMPGTGETALAHITKRSVLSNKRRFGFWERFLSSNTGEVVPATEATSMISNEHNDIEKGSHDNTGEVVPKTTTTSIISNEHNDIENGSHDNTEDPVPGTVTRSMIPNEHNDVKKGSGVVWQKLKVEEWKIVKQIVSHIRNIKKEMRNNEKARELVEILCKKIKTLDYQKYSKTQIYDDAILTAAELGVSYVVEEIMKKFPLSIHARKHPARHSIFHVAIENRSEDVFNLIHQMSDHKHIVFNQRDADWNNMLHLAGKLAPSHKLNEISGAALQMQRELQWFKEVEKLVHPSAKEQMNEDEKTPQMVFTDDHKILKEEGEKWMKETASSCTISAGLIATVMFAAAITVPGGTNGDNGVPIFSNHPAFLTFAFSVAISLFASITSLLLFLAILTSRYAEEDFLKSLPKRLFFGLASLFLSLAFMMASFAATLFLVFGQNKLWVLFTVVALVFLPVTSFVKTQLPLMRDLYSSTYGRGIFGKKSGRPFY